MKTHPSLFRGLSLLAAISFALLAVFPQLLWGDVLNRVDSSGSFYDNMWHDETTNMNNVNPKPGDDAYFIGMLTATGGSVHLLSGGGNLVLSGTFTAVDVGSMELSGSGTLNLQAIVTDPNGTGPILTVTGGHVNVPNSDGVADVTAAGTVVAATCSGTNGCGFYNGANTSLTLTGRAGPDRAIFAGGGKLTASSGLTGFVLQLMSGGRAVVGSMTNSQATIDGANSLLTVAGNVSLNSQSINISNGGAATVNGNLTQVEGAPLFVSDSGSSLTVGGDLNHNTASDTDIRISSGASITVKGTLHQIRGQVSLQDSGTELTVQNDLSDKAGFVNLTAGTKLSVNGDLVLDGGTDVDGDKIGGTGNWQGAGTVIDSSGPMFVGNLSSAGFAINLFQKAAVKSGNVSIGATAGSMGTVTMSDQGTTWEVQSSGMSIGQGGTGTFTLEAGARLTFDSGTLLAIGLNSGSRGTLTANSGVIDATAALVAIGEDKGSSGSMALTDSTFSTAKDFVVGDSGSGNLTLSGTSSVKVNGSATTFFVGSMPGSAGSVSVNGAQSTLTVAGPTAIGVAGNGFLGASGGAKISLTNSAELILGAEKTGKGSIVLDGANTKLTLSSELILGTLGTGSLSLTNGAQIALGGGNGLNLEAGISKGSSGTVTVNGSSFTDSLPLAIGRKGAGIFNATNGASVNIFGFSAPFSDGGQATISVDDSAWVNTYNIYLGDNVAGDPASTLLVTDGGTMRVGDRMTIFKSGTVTISSDSMMAVGSGAFGDGGTLRVSTGGILSGFGRVNGQVIVAAGGQIFPGDSPGIFNVNGAYQQQAGSTYSAEIGGTTAGTGFDQINVTGAATLGGLLKVRLVNGFTPAVGQTFQIVKAASTKGSFAVISQPSQAGITIKSSGTGVTITVTSVVAGAPVISSATTATAAPGQAFRYQIAATNSPTSYGASNLPPGLTVNHTTGVISGTPTKSGAFVVPINANNSAGSGQADLVLAIDPTFNLSALPESNLLNISTRLDVLTGDNVLIGGFIINGTAPKQVLLRGIGPSLKAFGITGALADPILELHKPDGTIVTNDNWQSTQSAAIKATGLAPSDPLESAILATLAPGAYTVILQGTNSGTGIGLIEAYDQNPTADSELANISTRGFVESGNNVMIGGFIVGGGGGGYSTVIVRGLGPSLTAAGVKGALMDPTLELHDAQGTILSSNDNWMTGPDHQTISNDKLAPSNPKESALLANLPPGSYTAILKGVSSGTGVGLVEVYQVQ